MASTTSGRLLVRLLYDPHITLGYASCWRVLARLTANLNLEQLHRHLQYHFLEPSGIKKAIGFPPAPTLPPTLPPSTNFCLCRWVSRVAGVNNQGGP